MLPSHCFLNLMVACKHHWTYDPLDYRIHWAKASCHCSSNRPAQKSLHSSDDSRKRHIYREGGQAQLCVKSFVTVMRSGPLVSGKGSLYINDKPGRNHNNAVEACKSVLIYQRPST